MFLGTATGHLVTGGGVYACWLTIKPAGSNSEIFQLQPVTYATVGSTVYSIAFITIPVASVTGDSIQISVQGQSGDTSVGWYYEIHTDTNLTNPF